MNNLLQILNVALLVTVLSPAELLAQPSTSEGPAVAFAQVTDIPVSLQSISGRFSSLNPTKRVSCRNKQVVGRVVSATLIMVDEKFCGRGQTGVLVNVQFSKPVDASRMVFGSRVTVRAVFRTADEDRNGVFYANFLIAEKAQLIDESPPSGPVPAFMSYVICQPPELDALAAKIGSELCVQNTVVENLSTTRSALEAATSSLVDASPTGTEHSDPSAITCRRDLERSDIHLSSIACARGSYWAWWADAQSREDRYWTPAPP